LWVTASAATWGSVAQSDYLLALSVSAKGALIFSQHVLFSLCYFRDAIPVYNPLGSNLLAALGGFQ
jgi:hypothetical protein